MTFDQEGLVVQPLLRLKAAAAWKSATKTTAGKAFCAAS
jgi:hypothetical protein